MMRNKLKVFHKLHVAHSAVFRAADQRTRAEFDLTTTQLAVLFVLSLKDEQPISEISKALAMGKSSLTGLVDRMVEKGLVERSPSSEDGRIINVCLKERGRSAFDYGAKKTAQFNEALLAPFSYEEREIIDRFLIHLSEKADEIINGTSEHGRDAENE